MVEFSLEAGLFGSVGAGAVTAFGWLVQRLWHAHRHEISDMKQTTSTVASSLTALGEKLSEHLEKDEEIQRTISADLSEIKGFLKGASGNTLG